MTSIAWDGKILAADGRATKGNTLASDNVAKIFTGVHSEVRGSRVIAYAVAGSADMQYLLGRWIEAGCPHKASCKDSEFDFKGAGYECIIITETDSFVVTDDSNDLCGTFGNQACGSGYDFILSALSLGMNSVEAVRHAASLDIFSGGMGTYIDCRKDKLELREFKAS